MGTYLVHKDSYTMHSSIQVLPCHVLLHLTPCLDVLWVPMIRAVVPFSEVLKDRYTVGGARNEGKVSESFSEIENLHYWTYFYEAVIISKKYRLTTFFAKQKVSGAPVTVTTK